jgi:hypothetical protein
VGLANAHYDMLEYSVRVVFTVERGAAALKWLDCQARFSSLEMIVQLNCIYYEQWRCR